MVCQITFVQLSKGLRQTKYTAQVVFAIKNYNKNLIFLFNFPKWNKSVCFCTSGGAIEGAKEGLARFC